MQTRVGAIQPEWSGHGSCTLRSQDDDNSDLISTKLVVFIQDACVSK
jgi:hypothetical protein